MNSEQNASSSDRETRGDFDFGTCDEQRTRNGLPERAYADIIDLEEPELVHKRMSPAERAAQFQPFAALNGFEDEIILVEWQSLIENERRNARVEKGEGGDN